MKSVIHYNYHQLSYRNNSLSQDILNQNSTTIKVANVVTLKGSQTTCGLYAITVMTSVANSDDLVNVIYVAANNKLQEIRIHLRQCFKDEASYGEIIYFQKAR